MENNMATIKAPAIVEVTLAFHNRKRGRKEWEYTTHIYETPPECVKVLYTKGGQEALTIYLLKHFNYAEIEGTISIFKDALTFKEPEEYLKNNDRMRKDVKAMEKTQ